jgi:hypothetical protein
LAPAVWDILILKAYAELGRLPVSGDPVNFYFEGLDVVIGSSLIIMYVCPFIWWLTVGILVRKGVKLNKTSTVIGIIGIVNWMLIIFSSQLEWVFD